MCREPLFRNSRRTAESQRGAFANLLIGTLICAALAVYPPTKAFADSTRGEESGSAETTNALKDAVILVVRHAEKPGEGTDLSPAGRQRAEAYTHYFDHYNLDAQPLALDYLVAAADSAGSRRPRLTLEPLSKASGLKIDLRFKSKEWQELARELRTHDHGKRILICWHHGKIAELVTALGANADNLLRGGKWPDDEFGWVLELHYDHDAHLISGKTKRVQEQLPLSQAVHGD